MLLNEFLFDEYWFAFLFMAFIEFCVIVISFIVFNIIYRDKKYKKKSLIALFVMIFYQFVMLNVWTSIDSSLSGNYNKTIDTVSSFAIPFFLLSSVVALYIGINKNKKYLLIFLYDIFNWTYGILVTASSPKYEPPMFSLGDTFGAITLVIGCVTFFLPLITVFKYIRDKNDGDNDTDKKKIRPVESTHIPNEMVEVKDNTRDIKPPKAVGSTYDYIENLHIEDNLGEIKAVEYCQKVFRIEMICLGILAVVLLNTHSSADMLSIQGTVSYALFYIVIYNVVIRRANLKSIFRYNIVFNIIPAMYFYLQICIYHYAALSNLNPLEFTLIILISSLMAYKGIIVENKIGNLIFIYIMVLAISMFALFYVQPFTRTMIVFMLIFFVMISLLFVNYRIYKNKEEAEFFKTK